MAIRPPSWLEIHLDRLRDNIRAIRAHVGTRVGICCVVKSDAYGLGAAPIAAHMQKSGVDMFAVFTAEQARELVRLGTDTPILVFMPLHSIRANDPLCRALRLGRLHCVVHDERHLNDLIHMAESVDGIMPVHIEVDTGMTRGGMSPEIAKLVIARALEHPAIRLAGIFSHFASSDSNETTTRRQYDAFQSLLAAGIDVPSDEPVIRHIANTHAAYGPHRNCHLDMVRVGLAWVGYESVHRGDASNPVPSMSLRPIARWLSSIVHVKWIEPGTPVGYGQTWTATRRTRVGLVPVGYADGYPLALSNRSVVRVCNQHVCSSAPSDRAVIGHAPVIGRVSMDQFTVDLTDIPEEGAHVGTVVEILADDPTAPNDLIALARLAETIPYEVLTGISNRISRDYVLAPGASEAKQIASVDPAQNLPLSRSH